MNKNDKFNTILSECLDRILKGETVEQCLNEYPEQSRELEPLLRTASAAKVVSTMRPRPEFKAKARYRFQTSLREMADKKSRSHPFFHWQWQSGWAIALVAVIVVVLAGGGTVAAASDSMPDSTLYPVKLATEQVQLAITPSDMGKAELNAKFADRRASEIEYMASKGDAQQVQKIARRLNTNLENMTKLVAPTSTVPAQSPQAVVVPQGTPTPALITPPTSVNANAQGTPHNATRPAGQGLNGQYYGNENKADLSRIEKMRNIINDNFNKRQSRLEEALKKASPNVKPAINEAMAKSQAEYKKAIQNLENAKYEGNSGN